MFCNLPSGGLAMLSAVYWSVPCFAQYWSLCLLSTLTCFCSPTINSSTPNSVFSHQCCLLSLICKVQPPHHSHPLIPSVCSDTAFYSVAFLPCVALTFSPLPQSQHGWFGNGNSLWRSLSSNSFSPPLLPAICKCLFASCPLAFFPSVQWWLLSCDMPLKINVSTEGKGRYSSSFPTYQICTGEHVFFGQECFLLLLAAFFHTDL